MPINGKIINHYRFALNSIKSNIKKHNIAHIQYYPAFIHVDKEEINAIKFIFPNANIKLCYYHFAECIKRKVSNTYFKSLFNTNIKTQEIVFGLKALSFISPKLVIPVFEKIKEKCFNINDSFLNQFIEYFEKEWINQDIKLWNYYNNFDIKTNNSSEGFNNHINHILGNKRPHFYNALYEFRI